MSKTFALFPKNIIFTTKIKSHEKIHHHFLGDYDGNRACDGSRHSERTVSKKKHIIDNFKFSKSDKKINF